MKPNMLLLIIITQNKTLNFLPRNVVITERNKLVLSELVPASVYFLNVGAFTEDAHGPLLEYDIVAKTVGNLNKFFIVQTINYQQ